MFQRVIWQHKRVTKRLRHACPISNLGEDHLPVLVMFKSHIFKTSVVKCAKVEEERSPEFCQRECPEILGVNICNVGTLLERAPILVAVERGGEPTDPRVFVPSGLFTRDIRFRKVGVRDQTKVAVTEKGLLDCWSRWTTDPAEKTTITGRLSQCVTGRGTTFPPSSTTTSSMASPGAPVRMIRARIAQSPQRLR